MTAWGLYGAAAGAALTVTLVIALAKRIVNAFARSE